MKLTITSRWLTVVAIVLLTLASAAVAESGDSTSVRVPEPQSKSLGDILLGLPSAIITLPVYVLKIVTYAVVALATGDTFVSDIVHLLSQPDAAVSPIVSYQANAGLAGGLAVRIHSFAWKGDRIRIKALYSFHDYSTVDLRYTNPAIDGGRIGLTLNAAYERMPRETFYGVGNDTPEGNEAAFTMERAYAHADIAYRPGSPLSLGVFTGYSDYNIFDGRDPDRPNSLVDMREDYTLSTTDTRSTQFLTVGGRLESDTRNSAGQPTRGGRRILEVSYNTGVGTDDDIEFVRARVDLSHYFNIYRKRIVAVRAVVQEIDRSSDVSPNPFYLQSALGGPETLRGYRTNRLVDRDMVMVTLEYRYPIWDVIDAFLFLDEGRVFSHMTDDFTLRGWKYSAGLGLRVWNPEEVMVSAQLAKSDDGVLFFFHAGRGF